MIYLALLDHPPDSFPDKDNLFAIVMETVWFSITKNKASDEEIFNMKTNLIRRLLKRKVPKNKIRSLFNFIEFYINFENPEYNIKFENIIHQQSKAMGLEAMIKEAYIETGKKEGVQKGM
ncbi:MAG TPA: hypothetical protein ENJ20_06910 [Bacteroidetes bacterium]|nr:hypothetical protein [Bacteroidota bacterium]